MVDSLDLKLFPGEVFGLLGPKAGSRPRRSSCARAGRTDLGEGRGARPRPTRNPLEVRAGLDIFPTRLAFTTP